MLAAVKYRLRAGRFAPVGVSWRSPSITTTVRKKGTLSTPSWLSAYTLDSFVALRSVKRFPPKTDQIEEASL